MLQFFSELRKVLFHDVGYTATWSSFASCQIFRLKCHFDSAIRAFAYLPNAGLQFISRLDRRGEPYTKKFERIGITATYWFENCSAGEAVSRETM